MLPSAIRILTVDTQALIHSGIRHMLSTLDDFAFVGAAYSADEALHLCLSADPDVALVEIMALGPSWQRVLGKMRASLPGLRLVVLSQQIAAATVIEALRAGAHGYMLKDVQALTLAQAVRAVVAGQQVLCAEAMEAMLERDDGTGLLVGSLSPREREVYLYLVRGLSNAEIARCMHISTATAKFHIGNLFGKLDVATRAEAIALAYAHGLFPDGAYLGAAPAIAATNACDLRVKTLGSGY